MRRDFAAFRVFRGSLKKLETRKLTRKVANLAIEILRGPATKLCKVSDFGVNVPRKATHERIKSEGGAAVRSGDAWRGLQRQFGWDATEVKVERKLLDRIERRDAILVVISPTPVFNHGHRAGHSRAQTSPLQTMQPYATTNHWT